MDKAEVAKRLQELTGSDVRSKTSRLLSVKDKVEAALLAGLTREQVLLELNGLGLAMSLSTFNTSLQRLRSRDLRSGINASTPALRAPQPPSPSPRDLEPRAGAGCRITSHNPGDLNRIMESNPDLSALSKLAKRTPR